MAKSKAKATTAPKPRADAFQPRKAAAKGSRSGDPLVHSYGEKLKVRCDTESRGHETPRGRNPAEIVLDASEGFIPLWAKDTTLRWRFRESAVRRFANPTAAKAAIRKLLADAILAWGDAAPVKFAERPSNWDFEIVPRKTDDCDDGGCVLASAFFPDAGRHQLVIYPMMFEQTREEQIETLVHEVGHIFGLRHFFAQISEGSWPSEIFGVHKRFTIMNYGADSHLTADDRSDLKRLYQAVWRGELTKVNGTPIKLVRPFHALAEPPDAMVALAAAACPPTGQPVALPRAAAYGGL
jgi:hypothetical protein